MTSDKAVVPDAGAVRRIPLDMLGIWVTPLTAGQVARILTRGGGKRLLLNHNLHSAYLHDTNPEFRQLYSAADWVVIDGTPIRWLAGRVVGRRLDPDRRVGSTDWIAELPKLAVARRLFVYGASAQSNRAAVDKLCLMLPQWSIGGVDGYVADSVAVARIKDFAPDIVLVGLGMPRQEQFLLRNLALLPSAAYATVGGAIDYVAGVTRLAPRWLAKFGLEWAWRLACQPRRLAHRYLVEPLLLLSRVIGRKVGRH